MKSVLIMPAGDRELFLEHLVKRLRLLPDQQWQLCIEPHRKRRSNDQNALLWALYDDILERGGEMLRGWTSEDIHEFMLGTHFGWETIEGFGKKRIRPLRRSSKLSTAEFSDFLETIVRTMAQHGVVLALPGDMAA